MGLFDIFKKRTLTHDEKIELAFRNYKAEYVNLVFPSGKGQVDKIIRSLAKIYNKSLDECDEVQYKEILKTYSDTLIRLVAQGDDDATINNLMTNHSRLIKHKNIARQVIVFCTLNMNDNDFSLDSPDDFSVLETLSSYINENELVAEQNMSHNNNISLDDKYGLVPAKPIYVKGISGQEKYLKGLKTEDGQELTWKRFGSTSAEGVKGMIDIYEGYLPSGHHHINLYLNMYSKTDADPNIVPKGLRR